MIKSMDKLFHELSMNTTPSNEASVCRFNEENILNEVRDHILSTYTAHYSKGIQTTEFIMSHANTLDWCIGNVIKYVTRYGHKNGHDRKDLMKAIHYIILMLYYGEKE